MDDKRGSLDSTASINSANSVVIEGGCSLEECVTRVKARLLSHYEECENDFYNKDVALFIQRDEFNFVERYLQKFKFDIERTVDVMKKTLQWRKAKGISQMTDASFPAIFYKYGLMFIFKTDIDGNLVFHFRVRLKEKFHPDIEEAFKLFYSYLLFKIDQMAATIGRQWLYLGDFSNCAMRNLDVQLLLWGLNLCVEKYPAGLKAILVYNLPWFAKPVFTAALKLMPYSLRSIVEVIDKSKLNNYIPAENLPKYLGGSETKDPRMIIPENCVGLRDYFCQLPDDVFKKNLDQCEKIICNVWGK
ncbi:motile sperm domain-containing protein 2-like protein [Dinothrombium tinctorium]|uniref:Motile sperm domain-containing protein 2-like protein n=1 Tax=Dinothrombium tinctorium TaxID=1965070 RepID=A0A3S3S653_9ACAR|nr:motile sperm domain-containing protein 2-like protein [Dinothrombium tinctorium]